MAGVAGGVSARELSAGNVPSQYPGLLPTNVSLLQPGADNLRLADVLAIYQARMAVLEARLAAAGIP